MVALARRGWATLTAPARVFPTLTPLELAAAAMLAAASTALFVLMATSNSTKVLAAVCAGGLWVLGAFLCGNARLFCLWSLMLAVPFDLSKRIGPVIGKMGGETSFRIEISDPFILALAFFLTRDILAGRKSGLQIPKVVYLWMALMAIGLASALLGKYRFVAAQELFRMGKVAVLFVVLCNELRRPARILQCATAITFSVLAQAIVGVVQYYTHGRFGLQILGETGSGTIDQLMIDSTRSATAYRVGAFLMHPNLFGIFLASLLPMAVALLLLRISKRYTLFSLATTLLGAASLVATLSRSGWLSFVCAFALLMALTILHHGLRRQSLIMAAFAAVALMVAGLVYAGPIIERLFESKDSAMRSRYEYLETARRMIYAHPLAGFGLNSYAYNALPYMPQGYKKAKAKYKGTEDNPGLWVPPVHNIFLIWWVETGIVGLLLFAAVFFKVAWMALRNLKVRNEILFALNAACLCGLTAFLVDGFFSFSLRVNSILRLFWVLAAMITSVHYWRIGDERQGDADGPAHGEPRASH